MPHACTAGYRGRARPSAYDSDLGFRVARSIDVPVVSPTREDENAPQGARPKHDHPDLRSESSSKPPPIAVAPFSAEQAKQHQQAWADYLSKPVEWDVALDSDVKATMVLIPPGEFLMGSTVEEQSRSLEQMRAAGVQFPTYWIPSEGPRHRVRITQPFALGRHEVTRGQFRQFVEQTGYTTEAERDGRGGNGFQEGRIVQGPEFVWSADPGFPQTDIHPVVNVSWNDAAAFCQWLSKKQGSKFDLPTEAQWEYACRAGTASPWCFGYTDTMLQEYAWFDVNSLGKTNQVGQLKPNAWGRRDMHGNVIEWCADWYAADYYASSPLSDPNGPTTGSKRAGRGGMYRDFAWGCRSAFRPNALPENRNGHTGFRLASVLVAEGKTAREQHGR